MGSGSGFLSGYGYIARSSYATPLDLGFKPWALDFSPLSGGVAFPTHVRINPYVVPAAPMLWQTDDWDPALRFWTLAFDEHLVEWLQDLDISAPSILAAREFARQHARWQKPPAGLTGEGWMLQSHLDWWYDATAGGNLQAKADAAWTVINSELDQLVDLMEDDRARYMAESIEQADAIPAYFVHLLGIDSAEKPHTLQLMKCGLAIGNLVYMYYKNVFRRVRPSTLCPGLVPPFGPPRHPAFPSGHSFLGHFIALLLLEISGVARRHGISQAQADGSSVCQKPNWAQYQNATTAAIDLDGSLFWLAARLAKNRERIGVHYPSDGLASRRLAGGIWNAIFNESNPAKQIQVPTLRRVLERAKAEWP